MNVPIGITTVRRKEDYFRKLLNHLALNPRIVVIAPTMDGDVTESHLATRMPNAILDPILPKPEENAEVRNKQRCLEQNANRLMRYMADRYDQFLILQDDVMPAAAAWERVDHVSDWMRKKSNVAWVSFYTPYMQARDEKSALWKYPPRMFYGDLAMLWTKHAAYDFLNGSNLSMAHDLAIQEFFNRGGSQAKWRCYGHCPCLFQHIGVVSATNKSFDKGQRTTMNFDPNHNAVRHARPLP